MVGYLQQVPHNNYSGKIKINQKVFLLKLKIKSFFFCVQTNLGEYLKNTFHRSIHT